MNQALSILSLLAVVALTSPAMAQKDSIELKSGSTIDNVKVISYTARELTYTKKGRRTKHSIPSPDVKSVKIARVHDALLRTEGDPEQLLAVAREAKDEVIGAEAYYRAAMAYIDENSRITALQEMDGKYPNCPYAPEYFRAKIYYFLNNKKDKSAATIIEKYEAASRKRLWSKAYTYDAQFWGRFLEFRQKKITVEVFLSELTEIAERAVDTASFVEHTCKIEIADVTRRRLKKYKDAHGLYTALLATKGISDDVKARVYLGLGYISLEDAVGGDASHYELALRQFLFVYTNAGGASVNLIAESLYNAAKAVDQWKGIPDWKRMGARLRGRLKRRTYADTVWQNKK